MKKICALVFGSRRTRTEDAPLVRKPEERRPAEPHEPRFFAVDVANYG